MQQADAVPPRVKRDGRVMIWAGYVLPLCAYALFVLLAPSDVLDQAPGTKRLADALHSTLLLGSPAIDIYRHARSTTFPQVGMLSSALSILIVVWMACAAWIQTTFHFRHVRHLVRRIAVRNFKDRILGLFALPAFGLLAMWAFFCLPGDPSSAQGLTTNGRIGYLFISSVATAFAGAGIGLWPMHVRMLFAEVAGADK